MSNSNSQSALISSMQNLNLARLNVVSLKSQRSAKENKKPIPSLLAKVIADRKAYKGAIYRSIRDFWRIDGEVNVKEVVPDHFLLTFENKEDKQKAWVNGPGQVQLLHTTIKVWNPSIPLYRMNLLRTSIWIQVRGLPSDKNTLQTVDKFCEFLGELEDVDFPANPSEVTITVLRFQVKLRIDLPILPGCFVELDDDEGPIWIQFFYGKLGLACYASGFLGHDRKSCKTSMVLPHPLDPTFFWFHWVPWLTIYAPNKPFYLEENVFRNRQIIQEPSQSLSSSSDSDMGPPPGFEHCILQNTNTNRQETLKEAVVSFNPCVGGGLVQRGGSSGGDTIFGVWKEVPPLEIIIGVLLRLLGAREVMLTRLIQSLTRLQQYLMVQWLLKFYQLPTKI